MMARILSNYAYTLLHLTQISEAAELEKEAVSLFHDLVEAGEEATYSFCISLQNYGWCCHFLGQHTEALLAYQESIPLLHAQIATNPGKSVYLVTVLHNMANSLHDLGKTAEAEAAAIEALQMNDGELVKTCRYASNFSSCFVCQRTITSDS